MKWIPQDIETYLNAKEYVDTAVIPLYSVSIEQGIKESAEAGEFITLLAAHLERQFTGRILLFPPYTYLKKDHNEKVLTNLLKWEADIVKAEFKHVFYLTADIDWRKSDVNLSGSVIWLPSISLGQMKDTQKFEVIDNQVKQIFPIFTQKWTENE